MVIQAENKLQLNQIALQPFGPEDFKTLIQWIDSEESLLQFAGPFFSYPIDEHQLSQYLNDQNRFVFKVINTETGQSIGHAEAFLQSPQVVVLCRILIGEAKWRGKGIGLTITQLLLQFSFETLHAQQVQLNVFDWNTGAIRCYLKAGFRQLDICPAPLTINGVQWKGISMAIHRADYKADT
ncbi:MAG: GNAT family N-acetyltransferase [Bacteroidia bacterium]|nr:GNAT family N-acetyltransferase [Bacteroidia bacterium]